MGWVRCSREVQPGENTDVVVDAEAEGAVTSTAPVPGNS
jgi:hypothetical protein